MTAGAELRIPYGPHRDQWGELHLPGDSAPGNSAPRDRAKVDDGAWRGVVVVIHGGYWRDRYTAELGAPVARALAERGFAAWNLEYRRAGTDGKAGDGGWPATFLDVAAGIDHLAAVPGSGALAHDDARRLARAVEAGRVVGLGHSAGGHLAVWAAGRHRLPVGSPGAPAEGGRVAVPLGGVVSQAGVLSLAAAEQLGLSSHAAQNLMGGVSTDSPELAHAFELADPMRALPIGVPVHAVHSRADADVPFALSADYVAAARAAGDPAVLHETTGDHFAVIDPAHEAFRLCRRLIGELLGS